MTIRLSGHLVRKRSCWTAAFIVASILSTSALAQDADATIVPPRLSSQGDVTYPPHAKGDEVVVLALTINVDGSVRDARVVEGVEPFSSTAVAAAKRWRFSPARRQGRPVAAIIRFEVRFKAPEPAPAPQPASPVPEPESTPSSPSAAASPRSNEPIDVIVYGDKSAPAVTSFTRAEVRQLPGAFGDPFRAIEAMPGVTPIASGLPFFYVRGAPPGNVGYFLDGVRVPYLYHVGLGPSVVQPGLVERVDLYPGGYPARFGGYAGGIVAGETTEPRNDWHGEGNLRLFDAGAMVEGGFDQGRGTVLLGGRYSYTAAILSLIAGDVALDYRDYQARVSYDVTPNDRVSVFGFGAYDLLGERKNEILDILFGSEFYRLDLRYDHRWGIDDNVRFAITLGYDQTRVAQQRNATDKIVGSRIEVRHRLGSDVVYRGGVDGTLDAYGPGDLMYEDPDDPDAMKRNALFPSRNDLALGGWSDLVLDVTPEVELTPGVRLMLFKSGDASAFAVDPRVAARFKVSDTVRIIHAYGIAHQPPSFLIPVPGLVPGTLNEGLQTSLQTSAGAEVDLPEDTTASATLFYNVFLNMTDSLATSAGEFDTASSDRSQGSATGVEVFVRRRLTKKLGGFLSYTLSRSMRSVGREHVPSTFDRTHVANAALAYDLGRNWRAGTRLVLYSGAPKLAPANGLIVGPRTQTPERSPWFYRVDLRAEKRWPMGERSWLSLVFEVLNTTLHKETFASSSGEDTQLGPITIPSVGLEGGF